MVDIAEVKISQPAGRQLATSVAVSLCVMLLVYVVYCWDRIVVPMQLVEIIGAYHLSLSAGGLMASMFTMGLALMTLPAGILLAKWGTRRTMVVGAIVFSACTAYVPLGFGLVDLIFARILAGVGEGFYNIAIYSYLGNLSEKYRGTYAGLPGTFFGLSFLVGPTIITWIRAGFADWRAPFYALAAAGVLGAVALQLLLGKENETIVVDERPMWPRIKKLFNRPNLVVCLFSALNGIALYAFITVYVTYLRTVWHFDQSAAAYVFSAYGIGGLIGGIPSGYLADRIGRRWFLMGAFLLCGIAGTASFAVAPLVVPSLFANFCFGIFNTGVYVNGFALIQDQVEKSEIPLANGIVGAVIFATASFSGWLIVEASNGFGWIGAAIAVYAVPYVLCLLILGLNRDVGDKK